MQVITHLDDAASLRIARLHACEAVKLTDSAEPYTLTVLADICYLHIVAAASGQSLQQSDRARESGRVFIPLVAPKVEAIAARATEVLNKGAAAFEAVRALSVPRTEEVAESIDLLRLAHKSLVALKPSTSAPKVVDGLSYYAVSAACSSAHNIARIKQLLDAVATAAR